MRADPLDLDLTLQTVSLLEPVSESTLNFNPYFPLLNSFTPFDYASILGIKGFGENLSLRAGFDLRRAESVDDPVTAFNNRDFRRGTLGFTRRDDAVRGPHPAGLIACFPLLGRLTLEDSVSLCRQRRRCRACVAPAPIGTGVTPRLGVRRG